MIGNPLGELFVKVGADTKGLQTGLQGAERQVGGFSQKLQQHSRAIGMAFTAIGGAILAMAALSVKKFAQMGDEVEKMSRRTGFATETLSELRHVAELSGTSLTGLEKASRTLTGTIIDANEGLVSYQRAFERIGVSYEALAQMNPEEQFMTVLKALTALEDETIRTATAADLFGARVGTQLLPMLDKGETAFKEMTQEAHDLNLIWSQESAEAAADFQDSMTKITGALNGLQSTVAEALLPTLQPLIDQVIEISKQLIEWQKTNPELTSALITLSIAAAGFLAVLGPIMIILPGLVTALGAAGATAGVVGAAGAAGGAVAGLGISFTVLLGAIAGVIAGLGLIGYGLVEIAKIQWAYRQEVEAGNKLTEERAKLLAGEENQYIALAEAHIQLLEGKKQLTDAEKEWIEITKKGLPILREREEIAKASAKATTEAAEAWKEAEELKRQEIVATQQIQYDAYMAQLEQMEDLEKRIASERDRMISQALAFPKDLGGIWGIPGYLLTGAMMPGWKGTPQAYSTFMSEYGKMAAGQPSTYPWLHEAFAPGPSVSTGGEWIEMQYGGIVPGPIGEPVPIIAHGGEAFLGSQGGAQEIIVNVYGDTYDADDLVEKIGRGLGEAIENRRRMQG